MQGVARLAAGGGDLLIAELLPSIAHSVVLTVSAQMWLLYYYMDILKVTYLISYILTTE